MVTKLLKFKLLKHNNSFFNKRKKQLETIFNICHKKESSKSMNLNVHREVNKKVQNIKSYMKKYAKSMLLREN